MGFARGIIPRSGGVIHGASATTPPQELEADGPSEIAERAQHDGAPHGGARSCIPPPRHAGPGGGDFRGLGAIVQKVLLGRPGLSDRTALLHGGLFLSMIPHCDPSPSEAAQKLQGDTVVKGTRRVDGVPPGHECRGELSLKILESAGREETLLPGRTGIGTRPPISLPQSTSGHPQPRFSLPSLSPRTGTTQPLRRRQALRNPMRGRNADP